MQLHLHVVLVDTVSIHIFACRAVSKQALARMHFNKHSIRTLSKRVILSASAQALMINYQSCDC